MDSLKHGVALAYIGASGSADASLELGGLIGDYIAVEIRKNEHLEVAAAFLVNELCGGDVNIPLVSRDFGVILADFLAQIQKLSVRCLYDVGFRDY